MAGNIYMQGDIRPVSYEVIERGLFAFGFTSGISNQIEQVDNLIARNKFFCIVPDHSRVSFIGRIRKLQDLPEYSAVIYQFIVDEIVVPREATRKASDA